MKKLYSKIIRKDPGFTLVELMTVVAIIGVLSGISIPSYSYFNTKSKENGTENDMLGIVKALEINYNYNDTYPSTKEGLAELKENRILENISESDYWGSDYNYISDTKSYTFTSNGKDKKYNTDDDIVFKDGLMISDGKYSNNGNRGTAKITANTIIANSKDIFDRVQDIFNGNKDNKEFYSYKTDYNENSWAGIIQYILQEGSTKNEISNTDNNAFGYINPASGNKNIVNYSNKLKTRMNNYRPAVLITKNAKYSYNKINDYPQFKDTVIGSVIIYKSNKSTSAEIYYIDAQGYRSDLELIE